MEIYIEEFLLQNILINFCLLKIIEVITKNQTNFFKILFAAIIGSTFSVVSAVFINNKLAINIIKLICALVMLKLAYKCTLKHFIFNYILLYLCTYALGGAVTSIGGTSYQTNFGIITKTKVDLYSICLIIIVITYIFNIIFKNIKFKIKTNNLIYKIKLIKNKNSININAYLDTGNFLNINGKPVIIIDLKAYLKLTKTNLIDFFSTNSECIKTSTVTGCNQLKIFKMDKVIIKSQKNNLEFNDQYIAVNTRANFKNTNYEALLSPMMF